MKLLIGIMMTSMFSLIGKGNDLIEKFSITGQRMDFAINPDLKRTFLRQDFFVEYDKDIPLETLPQSIKNIPFILNIITLVWYSDKTFYIDVMDEDLYYSLKIIKYVFKTMYPRINWKGSLQPRKLEKNSFKQRSDIKALTFSAGLDCTYSSLKDNNKQLLICFQGQDEPLLTPVPWFYKKKLIQDFAKTYGHIISYATSNYCKIFNREKVDYMRKELPDWRVCAVEGLGWAGLAAPILYTKKCNTLNIAASFGWDYPFFTASHPFIDNNIKFAGIQVKHDGFGVSRIEKIAYIVKQAKEGLIKKPFLKVCHDFKIKDKKPVYNCCSNKGCTKCLLTLMALYVLRENPEEYGFFVSRKEAIAQTQEYLKQQSLYALAFLEYRYIQSYMKDLMAKGEKIESDLLWLLEIDFSKKKLRCSIGRELARWDKLHKFLPNSISSKNVNFESNA